MASTLSRMAVWLLVLGAIALAPAASAEEPGDAIRNVILTQIEAFATDDAETAWACASDTVKQRLISPPRFLQMVKTLYPAIYRAGAIEFGALIPHDGFQVQSVHFIGPSGRAWDSFYTMEESDGHWTIGGVDIRQAESGI